MKDIPLLSIVIVNFNSGRYLKDAISSVLNQCTGWEHNELGNLLLVGPHRVELLVIDGGSNDDSVEIIKSFKDRLFYWVSEKDRGQSDAFNKGFSKSNGRLLTWLNADDVLLPGCLAKILVEIDKHPRCEWFTANFLRFLDDGTICEVNWGPHYYPIWLQWRNSPVVSFGPSTIFSKRLMLAAGGFDVDQHYIMDSDLWQRFIVRGYKQRRINCCCWGFRMHELSKTAEFGVHSVSNDVARKIACEKEIAHKRSGYQMSLFSYACCLLFRILDGSLLHRALLVWKLMGKNIFKENLP